MAEQLANNAASTLSAAITGTGDTSCTVANGTVFPATGNFRIIIDSEIIIVGARSGNTLSSLTRGAESTTAATHLNGAAVTHVLTVAGLDQYIAEQLVVSSYATTLPGSPFDGQEAVIVDSTSAPTYTWRFRYNAGSASSYKWEFIGGSAAEHEVATDQATGSASYVDLATVGPSITVPLAGDYLAEWVLESYNTGANAVYAAVKRGATATADADAAVVTHTAATSGKTMARMLRLDGLAASTVLKLQYKTSAGTANFRKRVLKITPYRVA